MKIQGLVRAFNSVRSKLQAGLKPEEVEPFREQVKALVRDVEELCRSHGSTPDRLPAPSRMAYVFLKGLDLDNLPVNPNSDSAASTAVVRIKNIVKAGEYFAQQFWRRLDLLRSSVDERDRTKREIGEQSLAIERICDHHGTSPSSLEAPSRQTYCWLKFLSIEGNLESHLEALERARKIVDQLQPPPAHPVEIQLTVMNALWRWREYADVLLIKVNQGFMYADQNVWQALINSPVSGRDPNNEIRFRDYAASDDFSELIFEIESFASPPPLPAKGRAYDLDQSFNRVNRHYFGGLISRPKLAWSRTLTMRRFGYYQPSRDTLMVSLSLDDPAVPAYVIDFVMYHELLHKKLGAAVNNGRRQAHSPDFRAEERKFAEYDEAIREIQNLALKHRGLDE